jgi:hypothetical protein
MGYQRLAYDDHDTTDQMRDDCTACASEMHLPEQRTSGASSMHLHEPIEISAETADLGSRLHLHLD